MGFGKTVVKCAVLVSMLIASSASIPVVENDSITTTECPESREDKMAQYRLPNNTIPRLYNIHVEPNMDDENFTWTGKTSIDIEVTQPTPILILHAHENLLIDENFTNLVGADRAKLSPIKHDRISMTEFLALQFDREILVGNYSLSLKYEGANDGDSYGFFRASNGVGDIPTVAATHFEATSARRAFPCWDEPGLKARFRVFVKHYSNYTALSNMPEVERVETPDGKVLTTFDTTPIMSTYLLTFVIADYQNVYNEHRNVSLHTTKDALEEVRHLLDFSPKVVEVMEAYTGFPFGFPRIGSVTLPSYVAGIDGTEHWGLVSYSEMTVRINAASDTIATKSYIDMIIAHELAHSWFGNRVTPLWWNDLWLSEAFAAYFQYYIIDMIYDNRGALEQFVLRNTQEIAFPEDGDNKNPVRWTPNTNAEIQHMFNFIVYQKGAAIIHMFRNVLGDDAFRAGIQKFMAKHSFKAVVADDLMASFQEAYDEGPNKGKPLNLKEAMTPWLVQKGYPIVNVTRNYTTGDTEVSQGSKVRGDSSAKWWIPLTYATKSSLNFSSTLPASWISNKEDHTKIDGIDKDDWIILNVRSSGYYRVNYDDENWNRLTEYLNTDNYTNIHVLNRARLINDAFHLTVREPNRYFRIFYKLIRYLSREVEYLPWRSAWHAAQRIINSLRNTVTQTVFKEYILELIHNFVEKVGFEVRDSDDHFTRLARTDVIEWACASLHHPGCSDYAAKALTKFMENPVENKLHPDTEYWLFCVGLRALNGTAAMQFANWAYENARNHLTMIVGCTENQEVHRNILHTSLTKNKTDDPLTKYTFMTLFMSTDKNFNFAVDFFLENHQAINNSIVMNSWPYTISDIVSDISSQSTTRARLEKLKEVLLLDAILGDPEINKTQMIEAAEKKIARIEATAAPFLKFWDKQSSVYNSLSDPM